MTSEQLQILQHALGCDQYGRNPAGVNRAYNGHSRNWFCAGPSDEPACRELVTLGFMEQRRTTEVFPYFNCVVTREGIKAMHAASPAPPKITRSQQRYREFLDSDGCIAPTFREYLHAIQQPWYKEMKARQ